MVLRRLCLSSLALCLFSQASGHGLKPFQQTRQSCRAIEIFPINVGSAIFEFIRESPWDVTQWALEMVSTSF